MTIFLRKNIGLIAIIILSLLPIGIWSLVEPLSLRFFDFNTTMTSFGQIAGLVGMVLFSVSLILSLRSKWLDEFFYGLSNLYNIHQKIGAIAFSLLLFHPLFLVVKYIQFSLRQAALFFLPFRDIAISFGIISLFLMIVLMALTFYVSLKYQRWKISHKLMVVVFIFALLHSFYITSDISRNQILRVYILGLGIIGLAVGFYRSFLHKFFNRNFLYIVKEVTQLKADIVSIKAVSKDRIIKFKPGQFVFVSFTSQGVSRESHPFSIVSAPDDSNLELVIKSLGDFTSQLKNLKVGDTLSVEGPFGKFSYRNILNFNQIWIAGGVGITPFLSMVRSLKNDYHKIDLYYCTKDTAEAILSDELLKVASVNKNFRVFIWCSNQNGHINAEIISKQSNGLAGKDIFLCGPSAFISGLKNQFLKLNINKKNIHWEEFKFL